MTSLADTSSTLSAAPPAPAALGSLSVPVFSQALQSALQEVLPSTDPLDSAEFSPITYINSLFPDESSLSGNKLDTYLLTLRKRVRTLNEQITRDVREHSIQRQSTVAAMATATTRISDLFAQIGNIKHKAIQSESMVQTICTDIRSLDAAKKHLTLTIRALRNLHMLVSAVAQLDMRVERHEYDEAARLVTAINDLFSLFTDYTHIPKIQALQHSVEATKIRVKEQMNHEFHNFLVAIKHSHRVPTKDTDEYVDERVAQDSDAERRAQIQRLASACALVDVLDPQYKQSILAWFSEYCLSGYVSMYGIGKEGATIDKIERRYAEARRIIKEYDAVYSGVFPVDWEVPAYLTTQFAKMTRAHIAKILTANSGKFDVAVMIRALQKTIEFEREVTINMKRRRGVDDRGVELGIRDAADFDVVDTSDLVDSIKLKYAKRTGGDENAISINAETSEQRRARSANGNIFDESKNNEKSTKKSLPPLEFLNSISEAFTPYMGSYVDLERKSINECLDKINASESWTNPTEGKGKERFGGSDDLFIYIKGSIQRCSKLTRNQTFFALFNEYKRGLNVYADMLEAHLPKKSGEGQTLTGMEIVITCYVVNTAEYCRDTIPALTDQVKRLIDDAFKTQVDLSSSEEIYSVLINSAVQLLVGSMWNRLNKVLTGMSRVDWVKWNTVGDESSYVTDCAAIFKAELPLVASRLSANFLPFFASQIAQTFIPKYVDAIYKCKAIGELGAQQMSLDAHALKNILLSLPALAMTMDDGSDPAKSKKFTASKTYIRYVNTEMSKAEALLKTLVSPPERLIVTFKALLPKNSTDDLLRIFALRGLKKADQTALIEAYNASVSSEDTIKFNDKSAAANSAANKTSNISSFIRGSFMG